MSSDGLTTFTGKGDGTLTKYSIGAASDTHFTFTIFKDAAPYVGATVTVEDGGTTGLTYAAFASGTTDSYGSYSPLLTYGNYYRITIGSNEKVLVIQATSNQLVYYISLGGVVPIHADVSYQVTYDTTTSNIWLYYDNTSSIGDVVTWNIYRVNDNALVQTLVNSTGATAPPVYTNWTVPADWRNTSYRIDMVASHGTNTVRHTAIVYATNTTSTGYGILPPGMDTYVKIAIGFVLMLMIGGIFSFISGPEGALVISVAAAGLKFFDVLPVGWGPTIMLCMLFAFVGILGRKGPER
jgi:hypothetical protein